MRTIVAGSRDIYDLDLVFKIIDNVEWEPTTILSGTARGVDTDGELWAKKHKIPVEKYPAQWEKYGKKAGYLRNTIMAHKADALIAVWDGTSRGTKHMIDLAKKKNLKIHIHIIKEA
jgi:hypothetical protein